MESTSRPKRAYLSFIATALAFFVVPSGFRRSERKQRIMNEYEAQEQRDAAARDKADGWVSVFVQWIPNMLKPRLY